MRKVKKKIWFGVILSLLISPIISNAQTLKLKYERHNELKDDAALSSIIPYSVIINSKASICITEPLRLKHALSTEDEGSKDDVNITKVSDNHFIFQGKNKTVYFKDYLKDSLWYHGSIFTRKFEVGETISEGFSWNILEQDTTFLNLPCKIATSNFRGQLWTAFFTEEFYLNGGPWKFDNLPGVILHVFNSDRSYIFNAVELSYQKETVEIENPFNTKRAMSWAEYTSLFKKKVNEQLNKTKAMSQGEESSSSFKMNNPIEDLGVNEVTKE